MNNLINELNSLLVEAEGITLKQLKADLKSLNYENYELSLSYNEKQTSCRFTLKKKKDFIELQPTEQAARFKASAIMNDMDEMTFRLEDINDKYKQIANLIRVNKEPDIATFHTYEVPKTNPDSSKNTDKYYPVVISKFDKYLDMEKDTDNNIGDK